MRTAVVIIDTTSFFNDYDLASREWAEVLGLSDVGAVQVVVPRVVVRETARHYRREAARIDRTVISNLADCLKQLERVASVPRLDIRALREELRLRRDAYEAQLESRLTRHGVLIADVPHIPTETLLTWAIEERQPFKSTGEGFRDALVWGTVLETAVELDAPDLIILVTANSTDFCDRDGVLAPALVADLQGIGEPPTTTVAGSLADALVLLEPEVSQARESREAFRASPDVEDVSTFDPEEVLHGPVVEACEGLAGQLLASSATHTLELETLTGRKVGLNVDLPPDLQDASVYAIEPLPETLTWDAYDRYGDRLLGIATLRADLEIDGTVLAADLDDVVRRWNPRSVDEEFEELEGAGEMDVDPRVWVTMTQEVELRFTASVGLVSRSVEGVELDSVTATSP